MRRHFNEAFDPGEHEDWVHPRNREKIENNDIDISEILPKLNEDETNYIEVLASERYQQIADELVRASGQPLQPGGFPRVYMGMMGILQQVMRVESQHIQELEEMALEVVTSLPDMELIKQAIDRGQLNLDMKIEVPNVGEEQMQETELSPEEELDLVVYENLQDGDLSADVVKRRFANAMIHGNAMNKFRAWQMVRDRLEEIDPRLPQWYGIIISCAEMGHWAMDVEAVVDQGGYQVSGVEGMDAGEEEYDEGDGITIKARGMIFPILIHEIVKGITEFMSYSGLPSDDAAAKHVINQADGFSKEGDDIIHGAGLWRKFQQMFEGEDQKFVLQAWNALISQPNEVIRSVMSGDARGRAKLKEIINQVRSDHASYESDYDDYENH